MREESRRAGMTARELGDPKSKATKGAKPALLCGLGILKARGKRQKLNQEEARIVN